MAYCRWSKDSDVYVILLESGKYQCCGCRLGGSFATDDPNKMILHLGDHVEAGQKVPDLAIARLRKEAGARPN